MSSCCVLASHSSLCSEVSSFDCDLYGATLYVQPGVMFVIVTFLKYYFWTSFSSLIFITVLSEKKLKSSRG